MEERKNDKVTAIVLAGGKGSRIGEAMPKQYIPLQGQPLLVYSLQAFEQSSVDEIILVAGDSELEYVRKEMVERFCICKVKQIIAGGKERYHSVYEGLKAAADCEMILIHDGARPLVTTAIIEQAIMMGRQWQACVVGMPVKDTIKVVNRDNIAVESPDRRSLWQIQTPQVFRYQLVKQAYDVLMSDAEYQVGITDDAMVVEQHTKTEVKLIEGSYENIKVTTPEDLKIADLLLAGRISAD